MNNIIVDIEDDTIYCYKKDNSYTNQIINQHTDIIIDICNIISQYVNCIIIKICIDIKKYTWGGYKLYIINTIREFMDFKLFMHDITIIHYEKTRSELAYWAFVSNKHNESTILNDDLYTSDSFFLDRFNARPHIEYRVSYLKNYIEQYQKNDESFIIDPYGKKHFITIYDHDLFLCLILIILKIVDTYN